MQLLLARFAERGENIFQTPAKTQSLMVWAGFGYRGRMNIAFPEGRMNATDYQDLLGIHLLPFGEAIGSPFFGYSNKTMLPFILKTQHGNGFCRMVYM